MKPKIIILIVLLITTIIVFGFVRYSLTNSDQNGTQPLKVETPTVIHFGYEMWPGFMMITIAEKLGYFEEEGIIVKGLTYSSNEKLDEDFKSGLLEGRAGYASVVVDNAAMGGSPEQIVIVTDHSLGGDGLVARPNIPPFRTFQNPKFGYAGSMDFFAYWIIKTLGKTKDDVEFVVYDNEEDSILGFKKGEIDFLFTYDPYLSEALEAGGVIEYSSSDAPGIVVDMYSFHKSFIQRYPDAVDKFTRAYFKAYRYWQNNKMKAYSLVGPTFELTEVELASQMKKIKMLSLEDNANSMQLSAGLNSLYGNLRIISMFMSELDPIYKLDDHYMLVYPDSIKRILKETK